MLIPWFLGLIAFIWYAAARRSASSRVELVMLSIPIYLISGVAVYIPVILIATLADKAGPTVLFFVFIKLAAIAGEVRISIAILRWHMRRQELRHEILLKNEQLIRPPTVRTAVKLLSTYLGTSIICGIVLIFFESKDSMALFEVIPSLGFASISAALIYMIWKGENWARVTYLILGIFNVFSVFVLLYATPQEITDNPAKLMIGIMIGIFPNIFLATGLVFLFKRNSSNWFKSLKKLSVNLAQQTCVGDGEEHAAPNT